MDRRVNSEGQVKALFTFSAWFTLYLNTVFGIIGLRVNCKVIRPSATSWLNCNPPFGGKEFLCQRAAIGSNRNATAFNRLLSMHFVLKDLRPNTHSLSLSLSHYFFCLSSVEKRENWPSARRRRRRFVFEDRFSYNFLSCKRIVLLWLCAYLIGHSQGETNWIIFIS